MTDIKLLIVTLLLARGDLGTQDTRKNAKTGLENSNKVLETLPVTTGSCSDDLQNRYLVWLAGHGVLGSGLKNNSASHFHLLGVDKTGMSRSIMGVG